MKLWMTAVSAIFLLAFGSPALAGPLLLAEAEPGAEQPETLLIDAAKAELSAGSYEQAITHFSEALEKNPGNAELTALLDGAKKKSAENYVATGRKLLTERKYHDAGIAFDNALDLVPGHVIATKGKDAAKKWPTAESYCETARTYLEKGGWDEAIAYYQKAYELTQDASIAKWLAAAKLAKAKQRP
jgi:tetratricopeptide (TPR) repeat protein